MHSQIESIPVTLTQEQEVNSICVDRLGFWGTRIRDRVVYQWAKSLCDTDIQTAHCQGRQYPECNCQLFSLWINSKENSGAEASTHQLFFCSRQMNLHTWIKKKGCHKYESTSVFSFVNLNWKHEHYSITLKMTKILKKNTHYCTTSQMSQCM